MSDPQKAHSESGTSPPLRVTVTRVDVVPGSTVATGVGLDRDGREVTFAADWRPALALVEALEAGEHVEVYPGGLAGPRVEAPVTPATFYVAEVTRRRYRGRAPKPVRGPDDVVALVGRKLLSEPREHFLVLLLNACHECVAVETVSIGSLNASIVHPREVFRPAVVASAASIIVAHNHPSGDPEPSEEDVAITRRLAQVGELLGIGLLDHVVIARRGVVSLRERRLM